MGSINIVAIPEIGTMRGTSIGIGSFSGETTEEFRRMKVSYNNLNIVCHFHITPETS